MPAIRKVKLPAARSKSTQNRQVTRKRQRTPVRLHAVIDENRQLPKPTLVFKRHYPSGTYVVPPLLVPLYWFDRRMIDKGWIIAVPPDIFLVDNRRFRALAQDTHYIGRFSYQRWLVYEEAAVPKGERP